MTPPEDPRWRPRVRLPLRSGPIGRTGAEIAGVVALVVAAFFLAYASVVSGGGNGYLLFPAFGIPDLLLAWFRWRRFRFPARWSTDLRATILLTGLTAYLAVAAARKVHVERSLIGVVAATVLAGFAAAVWIVRVVRDRSR